MANKKVLYRVDADNKTGYGHLMRLMTLSEQMEQKGFEPIFLLGPDNSGASVEWLGKMRNIFQLTDKYNDELELNAIGNILQNEKPSAVAIDKLRSSKRVMDFLADSNIALLAIDDIYENNHRADIIVNPGLTASAAAYKGAGAELLLGPLYIPLRPEFLTYLENKPEQIKTQRIFVGFGGSDPEDLTKKVFGSLKYLKDGIQVTALVGKGYKDYEILKAVTVSSGLKIDLLRDEKKPWELMGVCSLAICSIGATSWELALLGVPTIVLTINESQSKLADRFEMEGASIHFAGGPRFDQKKLAGLIGKLLHDENKRMSMSENSRRLVDGRGAERVAQKFVDNINAKSG